MQQCLMMSPLLAGSRGEWLGDREVRELLGDLELLADLEPLADLELLRDRHLLGSLETWEVREAWDPIDRKRTGRDLPSCKEPSEVMDRWLVSSSDSAMAPSRWVVGGGSMVMVGMVGKEGREARLMIDLLKPSCTTAGRVARLMVEEGVRGRQDTSGYIDAAGMEFLKRGCPVSPSLEWLRSIWHLA